MSGFKRPLFDFYAGDAKFCLGSQTKIMGVLNVTPDSFSDGGRFQDPALAEKRALQMQAEGAHLIDVGGESSRPGSRTVSAAEEIRRIRPVLKRLSKKIQIPISVDTYKDEVACAALDEGARVINDIFALSGGRRLAKRIARYKAAVVLMHMRGRPETMQRNPVYGDLLKEIGLYLKKAVDRALEAGIARSRILIDPGFGFGKTLEQNMRLLGHLDFLSKLRLPILVGLSRKSFLGHLSGLPVEERLYVSLAASAVAVQRGAHVLRVHDVLAHKQSVALLDKTLENGNIPCTL